MRTHTKLIVLLLLILLFFVYSLTSCGISAFIETKKTLSDEKHHLITSDSHNIRMYQGQIYLISEPNIFEHYEENDFEIISWDSGFPIRSFIIFYSYTCDNPDYFISDSYIWFKETFDYQKEIFVIEGTEAEIVFSDTYTDNCFKTTNRHDLQYFYLHHQQHTHLKTKVRFFCSDGIYYMIFRENNATAYQISDEFLNLLIENNIIDIE